MADQIQITVDPRVTELGVKVKFAVLSNAAVRRDDPYLEELKRASAERLGVKWADQDISDEPVIQEFHRLHALVGGDKPELVPAPEALVKFVVQRGAYPTINTVVDAYNVISAEELLALGAHDLRTIAGPLRLKFTTGHERFIPLGKPQPVPVPRGEYVYMDDTDILCRLEVRQAEKSKIGLSTRDILLIIQGNAVVTDEALSAAAERLFNLLMDVTGGRVAVVEPVAREYGGLISR